MVALFKGECVFLSVYPAISGQDVFISIIFYTESPAGHSFAVRLRKCLIKEIGQFVKRKRDLSAGGPDSYFLSDWLGLAKSGGPKKQPEHEDEKHF